MYKTLPFLEIILPDLFVIYDYIVDFQLVYFLKVIIGLEILLSVEDIFFCGMVVLKLIYGVILLLYLVLYLFV